MKLKKNKPTLGFTKKARLIYPGDNDLYEKIFAITRISCT
jgi:hypothetical protein